MKQLSKEELKNYKHALTVGELKNFLNKHNLDDNALILIQRVEDFYYENHGWGVYLKEGESTWNGQQWNEDIDNGKYLDKEQYPDIKKENLIKLTEEQIRLTKEQYHPASSCVRYEDDQDMLFIDLHY